MKKYKIELTEDELKELAIYTSVLSDIKNKKVEEIANKGFAYFVYDLDIDSIQKCFDNLKKYLTLHKEDSLIQHLSQKMKHFYAYSRYPQGGVTNWFSEPKPNNKSKLSIQVK